LMFLFFLSVKAGNTRLQVTLTLHWVRTTLSCDKPDTVSIMHICNT
jgi:hypothetical protein